MLYRSTGGRKLQKSVVLRVRIGLTLIRQKMSSGTNSSASSVQNANDVEMESESETATVYVVPPPAIPTSIAASFPEFIFRQSVIPSPIDISSYPRHQVPWYALDPQFILHSKLRLEASRVPETVTYKEFAEYLEPQLQNAVLAKYGVGMINRQKYPVPALVGCELGRRDLVHLEFSTEEWCDLAANITTLVPLQRSTIRFARSVEYNHYGRQFSLASPKTHLGCLSKSRVLWARMWPNRGMPLPTGLTDTLNTWFQARYPKVSQSPNCPVMVTLYTESRAHAFVICWSKVECHLLREGFGVRDFTDQLELTRVPTWINLPRKIPSNPSQIDVSAHCMTRAIQIDRYPCEKTTAEVYETISR